MKRQFVLVVFVIISSLFARAWSQDVTDDGVKEQAEEIASEASERLEKIAEKVDKSEQAQEISAGILTPIYALAERFSFPAFHWIAFALMFAGIVSFGLQLVLAKLVVLSRLSISFTEILSDVMGLAISLVGLVLTTQAAAENSNFTRSPAAVLSAAAAGLAVGLVFYWWGQSQEIQAVKGRQGRESSTKDK